MLLLSEETLEQVSAINSLAEFTVMGIDMYMLSTDAQFYRLHNRMPVI